MALDREKYFFTPRYTRGEVARVLGITKDTLRHYEAFGLVKPYEDKKNKYRYYSIADLEILDVILFLRSMDIPIQDIPKFIECKDIEKYGSILEEEINKANRKINYWNNIKNILSYLKDTLDDYKKEPNNVRIVKDTTFRFRVAKFDYRSYDIDKMCPSRISSDVTSHVIKLKIAEEKWLLSNREDTSEMEIGYLCGVNEQGDDICQCTLPLSIMITTLEPVEKIPEIILRFWKDYKDEYDFQDKAYIFEHTFLNIFNQEALLRKIYLPIYSKK